MKHLIRMLILSLIILPCLSAGATTAVNPENLWVQQRITRFDPIVPTAHPRLMVLADELPQFREFIITTARRKDAPAAFKKLILEPANLPLPPAPEVLHGEGAELKELWRTGYETAFETATQAQRYAFAYLLTGEARYGREAARWLLHLASWDVNGGINIKTNDEAFIQSLRPMLFAYDWACNALTATEKNTLQKALGIRLEILYKRITPKFSLSRPTPPDNSLSHPMRFISTLGLGGLVLYQDLPEAPTYLAWAYEYYLRQFPVWGGESGGWSEGLNYWSTGISQHLLFLEAMSLLGQTEILQKPFFRNNGYFALYNLQPYLSSSFGDLCNEVEPNPNNSLILEKYALLYQDPYLLQYFNTVFKNYPAGYAYYHFAAFDTVLHLYRKTRQNLVAADLADLPRSRYYSDIGWVALHTKLGDAHNDIMLGFKSSPFGSGSHSFSDQNSFVLNAFGEPLAISSGYREWYGSPHHVGWTRTTAAKNAVLINGQGQPVRDAKATGKILRFYTGSNYDFTTGDATTAYAILAEKVLRHVLFINRRYFIVYDELETARPATFQWMIHAKEQMQLDQTGINLKKGAANLAVRFLLPDPAKLKISQTDQFAVPVHPKYAPKMKKEWHVTVNAAKPVKNQEFLTLLYPYRTGEDAAPKHSMMASRHGNAFEVEHGGMKEFILVGRENRRVVAGESFILEGLAAVITYQADKPVSTALVEANSLQMQNLSITASVPLTGEIRYYSNRLKVELNDHPEVELTIRTGFIPRQLSGIPRTNWQYDPFQQLLKVKLTQKIERFEVL
ncbi:MAG TPA: DUF4962 domain-containing protein [Bacillota bacterium]|nr:DUF4962 domain-containing protein [Bacillota bacterium]